MEQEQNTQVQETQQQTPFQPEESANGVSFPTVGATKKNNGAKTLLIVGILVLVAILGFIIYKSASKNSSESSAQPSPFDNLTTPSSNTQTVTESPSPSSTPAVVVDKTKIQIQVLNGTGIAGEAAYLQTQLGTLGYTDIKLDNSDQTVTITNVVFSKTLDASVVSEITQKLNSIYTTVTTSTSSSGTFDVVVTTGLRKGATAKPAATVAPADTSSPSASPTATPQ